jgi:hypothetical protein
MGVSEGLTNVLLISLSLVALFYLAIPLLIYFTQKHNDHPQVCIYDIDENPPPADAEHYLRDTGAALERLGYEPQPHIALPDPLPNVRCLIQLWIHPQRTDAALISLVFGLTAQQQPIQSLFYTEFLSGFREGHPILIQTNNSTQLGSFPAMPDERTYCFPQVGSIEQLERIHRKLVDRDQPRAAKLISLYDRYGGDIERYATGILSDTYRKQAPNGYLKLDAASGYWKPTIKGAYLMTWGLLWPMSQIGMARVRRQANTLLRELDERPEPAAE